MIYVVTDKATGAEVYRYQADAPIELVGMEFVTHDHAEFVDVVSAPVSINPANWKIYVGSFFDRFGAHKLAILASQDPLIQAVIKDASVRKCIDLIGRRDELPVSLSTRCFSGRTSIASSPIFQSLSANIYRESTKNEMDHDQARLPDRSRQAHFW